MDKVANEMYYVREQNRGPQIDPERGLLSSHPVIHEYICFGLVMFYFQKKNMIISKEYCMDSFIPSHW